MIRLYIISILSFILTLFSCQKGEDGVLSTTPVSVRINTNLPLYQGLQYPGGWIYYTAGNKGIIVYRLSSDMAITYERQCPIDLDGSCPALNVTNSQVQVECTCHNTIYRMLDGSVDNGNTSRPMIQYNTNVRGDYIEITN